MPPQGRHPQAYLTISEWDLSHEDPHKNPSNPSLWSRIQSTVNTYANRVVHPSLYTHTHTQRTRRRAKAQVKRFATIIKETIIPSRVPHTIPIGRSRPGPYDPPVTELFSDQFEPPITRQFEPPTRAFSFKSTHPLGTPQITRKGGALRLGANDIYDRSRRTTRRTTIARRPTRLSGTTAASNPDNRLTTVNSVKRRLEIKSEILSSFDSMDVAFHHDEDGREEYEKDMVGRTKGDAEGKTPLDFLDFEFDFGSGLGTGVQTEDIVV